MGKCPKCPEGAPDWMVTYGDLVTLLLCFFVLLYAMSVPKTPKVLLAINSLRRGFGFQSSLVTSFQVITKTAIATKEAQLVRSPIENGQHILVKTVREGTKITIGGKLMFERGRSELQPGSQTVLKEIATQMRGMRNRVEIRGHCSNDDLAIDSVYTDLWQLSYARARAVFDYLSTEGGIERSRFRIAASGAFDPVRTNTLTHERMKNSRVEIILSEEYIGIDAESIVKTINKLNLKRLEEER